jgi:hypothetical protein
MDYIPVCFQPGYETGFRAVFVKFQNKTGFMPYNVTVKMLNE